MPTFTYQAKDVTGQTIQGSIYAENERAAAGQVRELGYFPMRVAMGGASVESGMVQPSPMVQQQQAESAVTDPFPLAGRFLREETPKVRPYGSWFERAFIFPVYTGVSLRDLSMYYKQFGAMLNAGMSIVRALATLREQSQGMLRIVSVKMSKHIEAGGQLSEAMAMFPHIFSRLQCSIISASEGTGALDVMMYRLSEYLEQDYQLRQTIKKETFLPKIQFAATFLIPTLVIAVVQGVTSYVNQAVLPLVRIIAELAIAYVTGRYLLSFSVGTDPNTGFSRRPFAVIYDTIKAHLPYFGTTVRMLALAKFSRALAALYSGGVLIPRAVETSAKVAGNEYLGYMMGTAVPKMMAGEGLTESFRSTGVFPPMFLSMMGTGETTGGLDVMLDKMAEFYEAESKVRLHQSVTAFSVLSTLAAGAIVGYVVVQFYAGPGYAGQINALTGGDSQ